MSEEEEPELGTHAGSDWGGLSPPQRQDLLMDWILGKEGETEANS